MDPVERFAELVRRPAEEVELAPAALAIAAGGDPSVQPEMWLAEIDRMAEGLRDIESLRHRLFDELGFHGNTRDYYDPENSFLHRVIERRVGLPITLSVLVMAVGKRAGIEFEGIGMPGHFLVRERGEGWYLDAFGGGRILGERECEEVFRRATGAGPDQPFTPDLLPVVDAHAILGRMLANLRSIYAARGQTGDLEWVLRMRLALPGTPPGEVVDLGRVLATTGRFAEGAGEIEQVAAQSAPAVAAELLLAARALRARLN